MREFKSCASVIIQSPNETVIHHEGHIDGGKNFLDLTEVGLRSFVEIIAYAGKSFNDGLVFRNFAVEYPERISFRAALAINAHSGDHIFQSRPQRLVEFQAVAGVAYGVQFQSPVADAEPVEQRGQ